MIKVAFRSVTKRYAGNDHPAVDNVTFDVPEGSTCMLIGTSGAGKTTLLRMVNRLIEPTSGEILIEGVNVLDEDPIRLRRRIGYVIQQVGLFPHLNVAENIRVTAEIGGGWDRRKLDRRVDELLDLVGLPPDQYRRRFPRELSGGQQQRVGLARALASDPGVLLMDEPFGALDAVTRGRMQEELVRIQRDVRKTILFVSHDIEEAFRLGDQVAVLDDGKLLQVGSPAELLARPADDCVGQLVGAGDLLRELRYLPVSEALDRRREVPARQAGNLRATAPDTSLLAAMLQLVETGAPALVVPSAGAQDSPGIVTLESITEAVRRYTDDETQRRGEGEMRNNREAATSGRNGHAVPAQSL